ncbi:MAG: octanoyltransferase [Leptospiraceae bacterium]|nr:MAG: octanoyltransferase [Leptospiraceae bacterium]
MNKIKNIDIYYFKTLSYQRYLKLAEYFRKKRKENLLFCDHFPVITAGIQYKKESFKIPEEFIQKKGIEIYYVKRGGDLTAHELGQIIIYIHLDLKKRKISITDVIQIIINITKDLIYLEYGISLIYKEDMPGLYTEKNEKIVSMGLEIRKGFTSSGIAINYCNGLNTFNYIFPCGYKNLKMNSIKNIIEQKNLVDKKIDDDEFNYKKIDFCKKWADQFMQYLSS